MTANTPTETLIDIVKTLMPWLVLLGPLATFVMNIMNNGLVSDKEKKRIGLYQLLFSIGLYSMIVIGTICYWLGVEWFATTWPAIAGIFMIVYYNVLLIICRSKVSKLENNLSTTKEATSEKITTLVSRLDRAEQVISTLSDNLAKPTRFENVLDGFLIESVTGHIFKLEDGRKRWIINPDAFFKHGFRKEDVWHIPQSVLNNIRPGDDIT